MRLAILAALSLHALLPVLLTAARPLITVSPVAPSRLLAPGALARAPEEGADCRAVCAQRRWASISAEDEAHMGDHPSDYLCIVFSAGLTYFGDARSGRCDFFDWAQQRSSSSSDFYCACTAASSELHWTRGAAGCPHGHAAARQRPVACRVWRQGAMDPADSVLGYLLPSASSDSSSSSGSSHPERPTCYFHRASLGPPLRQLGPHLMDRAEVGGPNRVDVLCRGDAAAAQA